MGNHRNTKTLKLDSPKEVQSFTELAKILGDDLDFIVNLDETQVGEQLWRRFYTRTFFAMVEGETYGLKRIALERHQSTPTLSNAEIALVKEESYDVNKAGRADTRSRFISMTRNLRFAWSALAKTFGVDYQIEDDDEGWISFQSAVRIRNRLTHPKNAADLIISDEQLDKVFAGRVWYYEKLTDVLSRCR